MKRPARPVKPFTVFLDRDGVLNAHPKFAVRKWSQFEWIDGAREALVRLNRPGVRICLATNQPTVGIGMTPKKWIERLHALMVADIAANGGRIDRVEAAYNFMSKRYKPNCGMLDSGAKAFAEEGHPVDKSRAVMVGDKIKDARAAHNFGIPAILVATTSSVADLTEGVKRYQLPSVCIVDNFSEAVDEINSRIEQGETHG